MTSGGFGWEKRLPNVALCRRGHTRMIGEIVLSLFGA